MRNLRDILLRCAVLALLFPSCEKDDRLLAGGSACEDFSLSNDYGTNMHLDAEIQWHSPCFNPKNSNEFVYIHEDRHQGTAQLRRHDLTTGQWQVLVETQMGTSDRILGPPSWGSNGWILFSTLGWDTWKVKDDGTELTRLTFTKKSQWPVWNTTATLFHSGSTSGGYLHSLIRNPIGEVVDTLKIEYNGYLGGAYKPDWSVHGRICTFKGYCDNHDGHVVYFTYGSELELTHLWSSKDLVCNVRHIRWGSGSPPTEIFYTTQDGLYRVDAVNDQTSLLMHFCTSIGYETFSIAPQGGFMLATRITARVIDEDAWTIEFGREIYRIDLTTLLETKVVLP